MTIVKLSLFMTSGLRSVNRHDYSQNKSKLSVHLRQVSAEGSEHQQTMIKLSFGIVKKAAYANKISVCLFLTKNMEFFPALILSI